MSKFSAIVRGSRQRKHGIEFTTLHGAPAKCDLRILSGAEYEECLATATAAAKKAGAEAMDGNIVFDFARAVEIVARAAVDPDIQDRDEPFFESAQVVRDGLDRERIFLLFEVQSTFQDEASPRLHHIDTPEEVTKKIWEHALVPEGKELPFERWQPALRRDFVRSLVDRLVTSDALKSLSTSAASSSSGSDTATSPPP